jgi:4-phytase / acid phosphatase
MISRKCRVLLLGLLLALVLAAPSPAQVVRDGDDGTTLKQIIIFGRHSIRSPVVESTVLARFAADPYPAFAGVPVGYLTPRGRQAEQLLGSYFHDYLLHEGLLTGIARTDLDRTYFRANSIQRSNVTAASFGGGLIPGATIPVHSYRIEDGTTPAVVDPVFDPVAAHVAKVDPERALAEVQGIFGSGAAIASAYRSELAVIGSVLYPPGTKPTPGGAQGSIDPTSAPFTLTVNKAITFAGGAVNVAGLNALSGAADPFVMQYTDGFPPKDVAWGRLSLDALSQQTRTATLAFAIVMRPPYLSRVQSSNAASHVLRSMDQAVSGTTLPGAFGTGKTRVHVVISSDAYVVGLAGLLRVHWLLPGYQPDFCPPGGALVFELRQAKKTKRHLVRVFYTAQSFDQLRNLTPLTLKAPPLTMQLLVPGGSDSAANLDVDFKTFKKLLLGAIGREYVQPYDKEVPPGVLTKVPLE